MKLFKKLKNIIYSQAELTSRPNGVKMLLQNRIDKFSDELISQEDLKDFEMDYKELDRLQRDQSKVKTLISVANVVFFINNLIFQREMLAKKLYVLNGIKNKNKNLKGKKSQILTCLLKDKKGKWLSVDTLIGDLDKQIKIIDTKLTSRNNRIKFILRLSESYKTI
jgi:hypothetical protein